MKIKNIICLVLCLIASVFALASCEEDIIKESQDEQNRIEQIYKPVILEKADLKLYIITEGDIGNTTKTVSDKIQQHLKDRKNKKFDTTLEIVYLTAAEYKATVDALDTGIVLIDGLAMLDEYVAAGKLANLSGYFTSDELIKKYGYATLNASYKETNPLLLSVAREDDGSLYFVPNNHVMGTYDYVLIDKNIVNMLNLNVDELRSTIIDQTAIDALKAKIQQKIDNNPGKFSVTSADQVVRVVTGEAYEDRFVHEDLGDICNILNYPEVTRQDVALSGFGVLKNENSTDSYVAASMEIIYLINSDVKMRNLLLYGVENTHYDMVDGKVVPEDTTFNYKMSLIHTGDIFKAYFCEDPERDVWTEEMMQNGLLQNKESDPANQRETVTE